MGNTKGAQQGAVAGMSTGNPWMALAGGVAGYLSAKGQGGTTAPASPYQMQNMFRVTNPWLYGALTNRWQGGASPTSGYGQQMYNMVNNPGYIDPRVMNLPYQQIEQGANTNLQRMSSLIGRNNAQGGMANMYAMANLATRGQQRGNVAQQYALWREQQRRADIMNVYNMMQGGYGLAQGQYAQPYSNSQLMGNAALGGLVAYGGMGGGQQQQQQYTPWWQMPGAYGTASGPTYP